MDIPKEVQDRYPIVEFTDLAELLVVRGITAVAYVKPYKQSDDSFKWSGAERDEDCGKSTVADDIGLIRPVYSGVSPIGLVPFSDKRREIGFPIDNAVSKEGVPSRLALTIGDFVAKQVAVRPLSWDDVVEQNIEFSYDRNNQSVPSAAQLLTLDLTKAERQKIFNSARAEVNRLVGEETIRQRNLG